MAYPTVTEKINNEVRGARRQKVPGGWLVFVGDNDKHGTACFLPDPAYLWKLDRVIK